MHQIIPGDTTIISISIVSTQGIKSGTDASIMVCILVQNEIKILPSVLGFLVKHSLLHMLKQLGIQSVFLSYFILFFEQNST